MKKSILTCLSAALLLSACGGNSPKVKKIEASLEDDKTFIVGDKLEKSKVVVKAYYEDGSEKAVTDWTCDELTSSYTYTAADGSARSKEFTITYNGVSTKLSTYAFDGKVTAEEWDENFMYIYNGNDGTKVQNFTGKTYDEAHDEEHFTSLDEFDDKIAHAHMKTADYEEETYSLYENGLSKRCQKKEDDKYYLNYLSEKIPSIGVYEDFDDFCISELPSDPRSFNESTRAYEFEYEDFGNVTTSFSYDKGVIHLVSHSYFFEDSYQKYIDFTYGGVSLNFPEVANLYTVKKDAEGNTYSYTISEYGTIKHKQFYFETVFEEETVNPTVSFYPENDPTKSCDVSFGDFYYDGKLKMEFENPNGYKLEHTFKKGEKMIFLVHSMNASSQYENDSHILTIVPESK